MKKWLILITLIFGLSACSSSDNKGEIKQEKLYSFLIVQDKLYAVGEHHDYQFEHDLVEKLDSFLKSPYEKFISEIEINLDVKLGGSTVEGTYRVYVDMSKQTKSQQQKLIDDYGFAHSNGKLYKSYRAEGKVVKLQNRDEILQKYRFQKPLDARLVYSGELSEGAEVALAILVMPVTIPLALVVGVVALPFQLVCLGGLICGY